VSYGNELEQESLITSLMNRMTGLHIENKQTDMQTEGIVGKNMKPVRQFLIYLVTETKKRKIDMQTDGQT
jgi:hypothetical protein